MRKSSRRNALRCAVCQQLEQRRLLATFNCGATDDTVTVSTNGSAIRVFWNEHGATDYVNPSVLTINLLDGNDTLNIWSTASFPVDVNVNMGNGNDVTYFSPTSHRLTLIGGNFSLRGDAGNDTVAAYDSNSTTAATYTVTSSRIDRAGWGGFFYAGDIEALLLQQSTFDDVVNVTSTFVNQPISLTNPGGGDTINVGNSSQGVQGITGDLYVNGPSANTLNINDTGNTSPRSANIDWNGTSAYGRVNNLAPAKIVWESAAMNPINITTGIGSDSMLVYSNPVGLNLNSAGGQDSVQIGDTAVGGAQYIAAPIYISNSPFFTDLTINNYQDTTNRTWSIDSDGTWGWIVGMTPQPIYWNNADINSIALQCGRGLDNGLVARLSETLSINNADGGNIDNITVGYPAAGGMQSITQGRAGGLTIDNDPDYSNLYFDDANDGFVRSVTLDLVGGYNQLTGLAGATIRFDDSDVKNVTIQTGPGDDIVNVLRAGTNGGKLTFSTSNGYDSLTLGNSSTGMQQIVGDVDVANSQLYSSLTLNNRADVVARNVNQSMSGDILTITGLFPGTLRYNRSDVWAVELDGGGANDTYTIAGTAWNNLGTIPLLLETGAGSDTLTVGGAGAIASVDLVENIILDNALNLLDMGRVELAGSSSDQFMVINSILFSGSGTLDLFDRDLIIDYNAATQLPLVQSMISSARSAGSWTGSGITSTYARTAPQQNTTLGAIEATSFKSVYGPNAQWHGYGLDNTAVLIKYTYYGDTDFNGKVDGADYARIDAKFNQQLAQGNIGGWFNGDLDYNGKIDGSDYALIDAAFNSQGAPLRPAGGASRSSNAQL